MVILVTFLKVPEWCESGLQVIDLFSGKARISRLASWMGYRSRAFDLAYHPVRYPQKRKRGAIRRSCMDINGAAGLVTLCLNKVEFDRLSVFYHSEMILKGFGFLFLDLLSV